jgi:hypothetical protein
LRVLKSAGNGTGGGFFAPRFARTAENAGSFFRQHTRNKPARAKRRESCKLHENIVLRFHERRVLSNACLNIGAIAWERDGVAPPLGIATQWLPRIRANGSTFTIDTTRKLDTLVPVWSSRITPPRCCKSTGGPDGRWGMVGEAQVSPHGGIKRTAHMGCSDR